MEVFIFDRRKRKLIPCHVSWFGTYSFVTRAVFTRADQMHIQRMPSTGVHQGHVILCPLYWDPSHLREKNENSNGSGSCFIYFFFVFAARYSC